MNAQFIRLAGHTRRRARTLLARESIKIPFASALRRRVAENPSSGNAPLHSITGPNLEFLHHQAARKNSWLRFSARPLNRWILKGPQRPRLGADALWSYLQARDTHFPPASLSGRTYRASSVPAAIFTTAPALLSDWPWIFHESSQMKSHTKKRAPIEFVKIVECVFLAALRDAQFTKGSGREQECIIYFSGASEYCMRTKWISSI